MERKSVTKQGKIFNFFAKNAKEVNQAIEEKSQTLIGSPSHKKQRSISPIEQQKRTDIVDIDSQGGNNIERDLGIRKRIFEFDHSERDRIIRTYLRMGPYQPVLASYPLTKYNEHSQPRAFSKNWFKNEYCETWLEYSPCVDKAYCLYCYLFTTSHEVGGDAFSSSGYNNWRAMLDPKKGITKHIGGSNNIHNRTVKTARLLLQKEVHIVNVIDKIDSDMKDINMTRLRLIARISRHLAVQGLAFRGHDEKQTSLNRSNFSELLEVIKEEAPELAKQLLKSPKNALYTSSESQKDFIMTTAMLVQQHIRAEIGNDTPYTILVDESCCAARKEWMALVIRWIDSHGDIQERFLDMIYVKDTHVQTLYNALLSLLRKHNLSPEMIRGQGFDGAANMSGSLNGLQSKVKVNNPSA